MPFRNGDLATMLQGNTMPTSSEAVWDTLHSKGRQMHGVDNILQVPPLLYQVRQTPTVMIALIMKILLVLLDGQRSLMGEGLTTEVQVYHARDHSFTYATFNMVGCWRFPFV
jgi:hypothetical protein